MWIDFICLSSRLILILERSFNAQALIFTESAPSYSPTQKPTVAPSTLTPSAIPSDNPTSNRVINQQDIPVANSQYHQYQRVFPAQLLQQEHTDQPVNRPHNQVTTLQSSLFIGQQDNQLLVQVTNPVFAQLWNHEHNQPDQTNPCQPATHPSYQPSSQPTKTPRLEHFVTQQPSIVTTTLTPSGGPTLASSHINNY